MPRPKKDFIWFNMRVDAAIMTRFNEYCKEVGQTKTLAFERIVAAFLDQYDEKKTVNNGESELVSQNERVSL